MTSAQQGTVRKVWECEQRCRRLRVEKQKHHRKEASAPGLRGAFTLDNPAPCPLESAVRPDGETPSAISPVQ